MITFTSVGKSGMVVAPSPPPALPASPKATLPPKSRLPPVLLLLPPAPVAPLPPASAAPLPPPPGVTWLPSLPFEQPALNALSSARPQSGVRRIYQQSATKCALRKPGVARVPLTTAVARLHQVRRARF